MNNELVAYCDHDGNLRNTRGEEACPMTDKKAAMRTTPLTASDIDDNGVLAVPGKRATPMRRKAAPRPYKMGAIHPQIDDPLGEFKRSLEEAVPQVKETIQMEGKHHAGRSGVTITEMLFEYAEEMRRELGLTKSVTDPILMEVSADLEKYTGYDDGFIKETK